jgi:hypothetical protein
MATPPAIITLTSTGLTQYTNLQDAIFNADPFGDVITVGAGNVEIDNKNIVSTSGKDNLKIIGNNQDVDGWSTSRNPESIIDLGVFASGIIRIQSNNVTVNGFTIRGSNTGPGISTFSTSPISGYNILCNIIENNRDGISLSSLAQSTSQNIVRGNLIQNNDWHGIISEVALNNAFITNNHFTGNELASIYLTTSNSTNFPVSNVTIDSNESISDGGIFLFTVSNIMLKNNILNHSTSYGILIDVLSSSIIVENNCILSSQYQGISIENGSKDVTISPGNSIVCNGSLYPSIAPSVAIFVLGEGYVGEPGSLNATGNYFGPNLGITPDNIIFDPSDYIDSSGTLTEPARQCPGTSCDPCDLTCPLDIVVTVPSGSSGQNVIYTMPIPSPSCGQVTCDPESGSFFPLGVTTVTCSSSTLPISTCSFTVTVNSEDPPPDDCVIACSPSFTVTVPRSSTGTNVTFDPPLFTGNCGQVTCNPPSGSFFPLGVNNVECSSSISPIFVCPFTITVKLAAPIHFDSNFVLCEEVCRRKKVEETKCEKKKEEKNKGKRVFYPSSIIVSAIGLGLSCQTLKFNPPSGSFFPLGLTLVVATDADEKTFSFFVNLAKVSPFRTARETASPFRTPCEKKKNCEKVEKKKNCEKVEKKNFEKVEKKKKSKN